nr:exocyst complex component EXO70B1-like [Ipomoea batatas]
MVKSSSEETENNNNNNEDRSKEVGDNIQHLTKIIESRIAKYDNGNLSSGESRTKIGKMTEEESFFYEAVTRLSKLTEFPSSGSQNQQTSSVLQRAMAFLEEEFRIILEDSVQDDVAAVKRDDGGALEESPPPEEEYQPYPPDVVTRMNRIANVMLSGGYETECCQVYSICRRNDFSKQMKKLEHEKIHTEDIQKTSWDSLEEEITKWVRVAKICSKILFPAERDLAEAVFSDHPMISRSLFSNLARAVVIQLLDFADAVAKTKRAAEKLFKFLHMYETIRDLIPAISDGGCSDDSEHEIKSEILAVGDRIGEASLNIFCDLENSIKNDIAARNPVPGGAVHPLTRYVINYLKYACDFKTTLEQIFHKHANPNSVRNGETSDTAARPTSLFSAQVQNIMDLLDANLEAKSKLYKDPSLRHVFLMNNGRYILQKIKGSPEIHQVMGDKSYRKRSTVVRQFHKNYQRETWSKVLQILSHEGLQHNGKVAIPALKERFKTFSNMMDEIHKSQSTWVVNDEQLQSELRVSISAVVIPAYRSFVARFKHHLDGTKHVEKYVKYQPDDIETLIEGLFDGNHTSMSRIRKN